MFWYTANCVPTTKTLPVMSWVYVVPSLPGWFIFLNSWHVPDRIREVQNDVLGETRLPLLTPVI